LKELLLLLLPVNQEMMRNCSFLAAWDYHKRDGQWDGFTHFTDCSATSFSISFFSQACKALGDLPYFF
jgi:hypothetical protein